MGLSVSDLFGAAGGGPLVGSDGDLVGEGYQDCLGLGFGEDLVVCTSCEKAPILFVGVSSRVD